MTLEDCLKHHRVQLLQSTTGDPIPEMPIIRIPSLQLTSKADADADADADRGADANVRCNHCDVYRSLAGDLLEELRSIKNFTSGMVASSSNDVDVISRQAAGFYVLHEKVIVKEMQSQTVPQAVDAISQGTRTRKLSRRVKEIAQEALDRLKDMPTASHKWTWGETLTHDDILSLKHVPNTRIHSGYEVSLKQGQMRGVYTGTHGLPTETAEYSVLPASAQSSPPPTSLDFPTQFGPYRMAPSTIGPISGDAADHSAESANIASTLAAMNDAGDGGLPTSSQASNLLATAQLWMETKCNADAAEMTTPTNTHRPSPLSNLAVTTEVWMDMDSGSDPVNSDANGVVLASKMWLEMEGGADPSHANADGVALASQMWSAMEGGADQVYADADASGVTLASQLWLDMEGGADPVNADADGVALASQIWLDIERGGDQVNSNADGVAVATQIWLEMDNTNPEEEDQGDDKKADQEAEQDATLQGEESEGDEDEGGEGEEDDEGNEDDDDEYDEDNLADRTRSDSQQAARRVSHLANLTTSPTQITLPRHEYTSMDFVGVPLNWFVEEELPTMLDEMGMMDYFNCHNRQHVVVLASLCNSVVISKATPFSSML